MQEKVSNPRRITTDLSTTKFRDGSELAAVFLKTPSRAVKIGQSSVGPTIACPPRAEVRHAHDASDDRRCRDRVVCV